jgi:hypothetical protein
MYFNEEEISEELQCFKCKERYEDPRVLPCGQSLCHECILELRTSANQKIIPCVFCLKPHQIPSDEGFTPNVFINKLLAKKPLQIFRGKAIEDFKKLLESINEKTASYFYEKKNQVNTIKEHCSTVRNEIDIATENLIVEVNNLRDNLLDQLRKFETDTTKILEEENGEETLKQDESFKKIKKFHETGLEILKKSVLKEDEIIEATQLGENHLKELDTKLSGVSKFMVVNKMPKFIVNNIKLEKTQLGKEPCFIY